MYETAVAVLLYACSMLASQKIKTEKKNLTAIAAGAFVTAVVSLLLQLGGLTRLALLSVPAGQAVFSVILLIYRKTEELGRMIPFMLSADGPVLMPLLSDSFQYTYALFAVLISFLILAGIHETIIKDEDVREIEENRKRLLTEWLPCASLLLQIPLLITSAQGSVLVTMICLSLMLAWHILFLMMSLILRKLFLTAEEAELAARWQSDATTFMNQIRSQRHDYNLHLHAISGLIAGGEYEKCREYADTLISEAADINDIMPVYDAAVGSMLYSLREEARSIGSDIYYDIRYDMQDIICSSYELNRIIGNLLRNSIDALQSEEDKKYGIRLNIFRRRGNTVIISENRFTGDPAEIAAVFELGYSTKKGHEGIGLPMVQKTVKRYGGRVYPEFGENTIRFVVNVPNRVTLQKGDVQS